MARFCPACGSQLEDNAMFCASCGTKLEPQQFTNNQYNNYGYQSHNSAPKKKGIDAKTIILIAGAAILLIAMLITGLSIVFPGPKAVAKRFTNGIIKGNPTKIVNCMPSFLWENDRDEKAELIDNLETYLESIFDEIEDYDKITIKVKEVNKLSKSERDELTSQLELIELALDDFDADAINPKKARKVNLKLVIEDGADTIREDVEITVIKYRGQWKVFPYDWF